MRKKKVLRVMYLKSHDFTDEFSLFLYFIAEAPLGSRGPPGLTAQGWGGGWDCRHQYTLCWFLADILLLVAAADNIP